MTINPSIVHYLVRRKLLSSVYDYLDANGKFTTDRKKAREFGYKVEAGVHAAKDGGTVVEVHEIEGEGIRTISVTPYDLNLLLVNTVNHITKSKDLSDSILPVISYYAKQLPKEDQANLAYAIELTTNFSVPEWETLLMGLRRSTDDT